jgi:conjugal transfer pilus assembly protein TraU
MKLRSLLRLVAAVAAGLLLVQGASAQVGRATCTGRFINWVSDVCWDCMFPIAIGRAAVSFGQEDNDSNQASPLCVCPKASFPWVRLGLALGYWEPAYTTEFVRTPFCFPTLGGFYMSGSQRAVWGARDGRGENDQIARTSIYQAHNYETPLLSLLGIVTTQYCTQDSGYDLAYMTEYDPTWDDDESALLLAPESVLFANILAVAACTVDCVRASTGFGIREMFWCGGCNGHMYPMNGKGQVHQGGVQATALLTQRFMAKMHRQFIAWQTWGQMAVCFPHFAPLMDKQGYKTQIIYPRAMTAGTDGTGPRRCCQPFGRTTQLYGSAREFPIRGEDFAFLVWRKRNCCASE